MLMSSGDNEEQSPRGTRVRRLLQGAKRLVAREDRATMVYAALRSRSGKSSYNGVTHE